MPKYEKHRNEKLRSILRPQMPTASHRKTVWDYANSSLTIWVLTVVLGGFVTFLYSNQQACIKDSEQKISRITDDKDTLLARLRMLAVAMKTSSTFVEFKAFLAIKGISVESTKDKATLDLFRELGTATQQMEPRPFTHANMVEVLKRADIQPDDITAAFLFLLLENANVDIPDEAIKSSEPLADKLARLYDDLSAIDGHWDFKPKCGLFYGISSVWDPTHPIIEAIENTETLPEYFQGKSLVETLKSATRSKEVTPKQHKKH